MRVWRLPRYSKYFEYLWRARMKSLIKYCCLLSIFFVLLFHLGCASGARQAIVLTPADLQLQHPAEFVLVSHPDMKFYWQVIEQIYYGDSSSIYEVQKDKPIRGNILFSKEQENELERVEPFLRQFQECHQLTGDIFWETLQKVLPDAAYLSLSPYSGAGTTNEFSESPKITGAKNAPIEFLEYIIRAKEEQPAPEWYLVLEVKEIGLIKLGNRSAAGGNLESALKGLLKHAVLPKEWAAYVSGHLIIAEAATGRMRWMCGFRSMKTISKNLDDVLKMQKKDFLKAVVSAVSISAAKSGASLVKNKCVEASDPLLQKYKLSTSDLEVLVDKMEPVKD